MAAPEPQRPPRRTVKDRLPGVLRLPGRIVRGIGVGVFGLVLLFEEWGWEPLARLLARIGRLPGLRWIEARVRELPPYAALALFIVPVLTLLPLKLLALYWLGKGRTVLGISIIIAAKLAGTAITARLFMLTRDTLMQLAWFARWLNRWLAFKDHMLAAVRATRAWRAWLAARHEVKRLALASLAWLRKLF